MRRPTLLFAVLMVFPLLGSNSPRWADDAAVEMQNLEGSWRLVEYEVAGAVRQMPDGMIMTYYRREVAWWPPSGGGPNEIMGTYCAEPNTRPARLDRMDTGGFHKGKTWRSIYQIDGDTLRVAYKTSGAERPKGFDDKA